MKLMEAINSMKLMELWNMKHGHGNYEANMSLMTYET
jgi:hypothetical protein